MPRATAGAASLLFAWWMAAAAAADGWARNAKQGLTTQATSCAVAICRGRL